ncbi:MAG: undecaprenyl-diphosphate phosphatase [Alphaproteobacteria bacterium]|nr:undecaprenyl-diphosphate phosphatase [Alphaproteobacteria bacterium]
MTVLHLFILSLIQGLTEFLPISSSGHLILLPQIFGWQNQGLEMDVALHVGTLAAVLIYFRNDVWKMITHFITYCIRGFSSQDFDQEVKLAFSLIVATLPAVFVGFLLKKSGLGDMRQVSVIAFTSLFFGLVLFVFDHIGTQKKDLNQITLKRGFLIGLGQAISLVPGVSRSGICISVGLALGFNRLAAARFAFLMAIPSIIGAATLTAYDALQIQNAVVWADIGLGIVFSSLAGLAAIHFMLTFLARHTLTIFVIYRIILSVGIWVFLK